MFDAHCHIHFSSFDSDRSAVMMRAVQEGVTAMIIANYGAQDREALFQVTEQYSCWCTLGVHPWLLDDVEPDQYQVWIAQQIEFMRNRWEQWSKKRSLICAVGECGLDRHRAQWGTALWYAQVSLFHQHVQFAVQRGLPLVVHAVKSYDDVYKVLAKFASLPAVQIHGFQGSWQQAQKLVQAGCYLSFGFALCAPQNKKLREIFARLLLQFPKQWMLETDAPASVRDLEKTKLARREPAEIKKVFQEAAKLSGRSVEDIVYHNEENIRRCFAFEKKRWLRGDARERFT